MGTNLSPALLGVGYIVGLNIGIVVLLGSMIVVEHRDPDLPAFFLDAQPGARRAASRAAASAEDAAGAIWSAQIRYLGVGAMLVGGMWALVSAAQFDGVGHQERPRRDARRRRRAWSRTPSGTCR